VTASASNAWAAPDLSRASAQEAHIVLRWLVRLRWLAVAGQTIATGVAVGLLKLKLPLGAIESVILLTVVSNILLQLWTMRSEGTVPPWLVPAVLILDVCLLTALLICSGGPSNPFSALYLVHVAMAVVTLDEQWPWLVVATTAACYGTLFLWPTSHSLGLASEAAAAADWAALVLVAIVIVYFVGRTARSLRRREKELANARERAARNEQLAALTTLAAGAAHELNTPLSTIAVVAKELEVQSKALPSSEAFVNDARLIRQEVDRCQVILGRMRVDVLQGEWRKRTAVAAGDFVASLLRDLEPAARDQLKVECKLDLPSIQLPVRAVQQTLGILVDNAVDATPTGKDVRLSIYPHNGNIVFEVQDQGPGMSAEVARRAGEPFFTTKAPGQGMGLGLFLARLVAEKLGGTLTLQSRPGEGTKAVLELPAH
jgi:two-component system, sensor histidine kinase RegB